MFACGRPLDPVRGFNDQVETPMNGKVLAIVSVIVGGVLSATSASANDYGRWGGLGEPRWQPPTYAQPHRQQEARFGGRDDRWRDRDWDRREPRGHHYGWFREHHRLHHHHPRRWWD